MQNRREFLKRASLMLAGGMVMPQLFFKRPCKRRRNPEGIGNGFENGL